jgi:ubiquitin carboxyl-terminal hydrolase 7
VSCIHVACESSRVESFYDLQLDVKHCRNLYESFQKFTQIEILEGENQFDAKEYGFGKEDAKKGLAFETFPPILNLQLKRYR